MDPLLDIPPVPPQEVYHCNICMLLINSFIKKRDVRTQNWVNISTALDLEQMNCFLGKGRNGNWRSWKIFSHSQVMYI